MSEKEPIDDYLEEAPLQEEPLFHDREFDPEAAEREARQRREEEFARRVRREVRRMKNGEAEEELIKDDEREEEERQQEEKALKKAQRRKKSTFWQIITGTILVQEGLSKHYGYLWTIAGMFFLSIAMMFTALHADMKYSHLDREVKVLRAKQTHLQRQRTLRTTHSAITKELKKRGIPLQDPRRQPLKIEE